MKQRAYTILLSIALAAFLSGCSAMGNKEAAGSERLPGKIRTDAEADKDEAAAENDENMNITAEDPVESAEETEPADALVKETEDVREIYLDFMRGNTVLTIPDAFEGEEDYYAAIRPGEYTYPELKAAYETGDGHDTTTIYAFADLGGDRIEELVLCFKNTEPSFLNWTGIIHYEDGRLELVHSYEDGYRISSTLYEAGFLEVGGSFGAGAHGTDYFAFSGKGSAEKLFTVNYFYSGFATQISYDLTSDRTGYKGDAFWGDENCELEVTEYVPAENNGKGVKISVEKYSADLIKKAEEEEFIKELVEMGAEEISSEAMKKLTGHEGFSGPQVKWQDWEEVCTIVKAADFQYVYPKPEDYLEVNCVGEDNAARDYAQKVLITTNKPLQDVRVWSFSLRDYSEEGGCIYTAEKVREFEKLTPDKPLAIDMIFMGDTPNMGISYVDENGTEKTLAIAMSGMDGSICLEEAQIR